MHILLVKQKKKTSHQTEPNFFLILRCAHTQSPTGSHTPLGRTPDHAEAARGRRREHGGGQQTQIAVCVMKKIHSGISAGSSDKCVSFTH